MGKFAKTTSVVFVAFLIPIIPYLLIGELPGQRWLSAGDKHSLIFALSGAVLLASDILLPIPSSIVGTLMGARLGIVSGWFWVWTGLSCGNLIGYLVGSLWPSRLAIDIPGHPGLLILLLSRPIPVVAEAMALLAGANRVKLPVFLLSCLLGNALYSLALVYNGSSQVSENSIWGAVAIAMLIPVAGYGIWKLFLRRRMAPW